MDNSRKMRTPTRQRPKIWDQIERQYLDTLAAAYGRPKDRPKSKQGAARLAALLGRVDDSQGSILGQDGLALIAEIRGDFGASAGHRLEGAKLISQLLSTGYPLDDYGWDDVAERLTLAAIEYDQLGDTGEAIKCLRRAEVTCLQHGLPFDGKQLLDELGDAADVKAPAVDSSKGKRPLRPTPRLLASNKGKGEDSRRGRHS